MTLLLLSKKCHPITASGSHQALVVSTETKAEALADIPRIREQHEVAGSGQFLFNRQADDDYETALKLAGGVSMHELAKFWRLHHPEKPKRRLHELMEAFLADVKLRHGDGAHYRDLKSRGRAFIAAGYGERYADTVTRQTPSSFALERTRIDSIAHVRR